MAGRRPAGQAVRVRHRRRGRAAARPILIVRAARQPGLVAPSRSSCSSGRRSGAWPAARDLLRPVDRAVLGDAVTKSHGRRAFVRVVAERDADGAPDARRAAAASASDWLAARAGEPRHLGARRRRRTRGHPRGGRRAARRRRGRAVVARPGLSATRPDGPEDRWTSKPAPPRAERRRLTHVDRSGPAADGRRLGQAGHGPPGRRRGHWSRSRPRR